MGDPGGEGGDDVSGVPPRPDVPRGEAGAERRGATWRWWEALLAYVLAVVLAGAVTLPLLEWIEPPGTARLVAAVAGDAVVVGLLLLWLRRFHPSWQGAVGLPDRPGSELGAGVVAGLVLYPVVAFVIGPVLALILRAATGEVPTPPEQVPGRLSALGLVAVVVFGLLAAPVQEELVFRGLLFRSLRERYGFRVAAWGSAGLFGAVHYYPSDALADSILLMAAMVATGYGLAIVYERRGNILAPIVAHASFNLIGLVFVLGRVTVG